MQGQAALQGRGWGSQQPPPRCPAQPCVSCAGTAGQGVRHAAGGGAVCQDPAGVLLFVLGA